jgi:MFS family permease
MVELKKASEEPDNIGDENKLVKKSLSNSIKDGAFFSIMDSIMGNFLSAYAIFLGAPNIIISLLSSLPGLFGSLFQLLAIKVKDIFKEIKPAIVIAAFFQGFIILFLLTLPMVDSPLRYIFLLIIAIGFTMVGNFISPLWRSLMGDLVPEDERGAYFSKRTLITGIISFIATLGAGFVLNHYKKLDHALTGFIILFIVASISRAISSFWLSRLYEKKREDAKEKKGVPKKDSLSFFNFVKNLSSDDFGKFVIFVSLFSLAVAVASPFFVVYMLKVLNLSYTEFTILTLAELMANLGFLRVWGYFNDKNGSKFVIRITGFLIPFVPLLWLFGKNFYYLLALQIFSGIIWGGFNLAIGNFLFDATEQKTRTKQISYFNLFNGMAVFIGALFGGLLLQHLSSVKTLFLISFILRMIVAIIFIIKLKEMRLIEMPVGKSFMHYHIYIKPKRLQIQNDMYYPVDRLKKEKERKVKKEIYKEKITKQNAGQKDDTNNSEKKKNEKRFVEYMFKNMQNKK